MRLKRISKRITIGLVAAVALNFATWLLFVDSHALAHRVAAQGLAPIGCDYVIAFGDLAASGVIHTLKSDPVPRVIPQILSRVDVGDIEFGAVAESGDRLEQTAGRKGLRVVHLAIDVDDRIPCVATVADELYARGNFGAGWRRYYLWCGWIWVRVWSSVLWTA